MSGYPGIVFDAAANVYTISTSAADSSIQSVIDSAANGATIRFSAGVHTLTQPLLITRDHISIEGMGEGLTKIVLSGLHDDGITFKGKVDTSWSTTLKVNVAEGSNTITLNNVTGLKAGDILMVSQANDAQFLSSGLYDNVLDSPYMALNPLRESIVEILSISGNVVTLKHDVAYAMQGSLATVQKLNMLRDVGLSDLTVTYDLGTPDADNFSNTLSSYEGANAVVFNYTKNADISNITILNAASNGLELQNALQAQVDSVTVQGAHNKGGEGNGYGIELAGSFYSTLTNLDITDTRHAVLFSSWNGEAYNTIHVANTNRDINYHGSDDHDNTVVVDRVVYEGAVDQAWALVSPGSTMHPYTQIDDNTTVFRYAEGSFKDDTVYAHSAGGELYGRGGNDRLYGGAGADTLEGGADNDTLTGGGGREKFVFRAGDGQDVVTDFQAGDNGDRISLYRYAAYQQMSDLVLRQNGSDTELVLFLSNSVQETITLKNVSVSALNASNFIFHAAEAQNIDTILGSGNDVVIAAEGTNDILRTASSNLSNQDRIELKTGFDTLQFTTSSFTLYADLLPNLSGVDALDVTLASTPKLILNQGILDQSDNNSITVVYGASGLERLAAAGLSEDSKVLLKGSAGTVMLADNVDNRVTVTEETGGGVTGRRGDDVFVVNGRTPATLDGGEGRDTFLFTDDHLTAATAIKGGSGIDTLWFTTGVKVSAVDIARVSGIEKIRFDITDSTFALTNALMDYNPVFEGGNYRVTLRTDVSGLTEAATINVGEDMYFIAKGIAAAPLAFVLLADSSRVRGSDAADTFVGSAFGDSINGGGGDDVITGGGGKDDMTGGLGRDTFKIRFGDATDAIHDFQKGSGGDILHLTGYYHLNGFSDLNLVQSGVDVRLRLNAQEEVIFRNTTLSGFTAANFAFDNSVVINETIFATADAERLITGGGDDMLEAYGSQLNSGDIVDLGGGTDILKFLSASFTFDSTQMALITGIEIIDTTLATLAPHLVISAAMASGSDADDLTILYGSAGLSQLDTSRVSTSIDVLLQGGAAHISLADAVNNRVVLEVADGVVLDGGSGDDYIRLRGGSVTASGGGGNDTISVTGSGAYDLSGGGNDDIFLFTLTSMMMGQHVDGGTGYDEMRLYTGAALLGADLANVTGMERVTLYGSTNNIVLTGNVFDSAIEFRGGGGTRSLNLDISALSSGQTVIIGERLSTSLTGISGNSYTIETTSDTSAAIHGTKGNDTFLGNTASDVLYGNDGLDFLYGGYGNDTLYGEKGNDVINGQKGTDALYGGLGNDTFVFSALGDLGDVIGDFHAVSGDNDRLDLTALFDANGLGGVTNADAAFSQKYLSLQQVSGGTNLMFDRDGAATKYSSVLVALLEDVVPASVSHSNILV